MTTDHRLSRETDGKGRTIRELSAGREYAIDYYSASPGGGGSNTFANDPG